MLTQPRSAHAPELPAIQPRKSSCVVGQGLAAVLSQMLSQRGPTHPAAQPGDPAVPSPQVAVTSSAAGEGLASANPLGHAAAPLDVAHHYAMRQAPEAAEPPGIPTPASKKPGPQSGAEARHGQATSARQEATEASAQLSEELLAASGQPSSASVHSLASFSSTVPPGEASSAQAHGHRMRHQTLGYSRLLAGDSAHHGAPQDSTAAAGQPATVSDLGHNAPRIAAMAPAIAGSRAACAGAAPSLGSPRSRREAHETPAGARRKQLPQPDAGERVAAAADSLQAMPSRVAFFPFCPPSTPPPEPREPELSSGIDAALLAGPPPLEATKPHDSPSMEVGYSTLCHNCLLSLLIAYVTGMTLGVLHSHVIAACASSSCRPDVALQG